MDSSIYDLVVECAGCGDDKTVDLNEISVMETLANIWNDIHAEGWREVNKRRYCTDCVTYLKNRTDDDELVAFGLTPQEARQLEQSG